MTSRASSVGPPGDAFLQSVADFAHAVGQRMRGDGRPEDRLRAPVSELVKANGRLLGMEMVVHDEVTLRDLRSRPDLAVDARGGRVGYIELKAPGKGTPVSWRPTAHDQEQWQRLQVLPNLDLHRRLRLGAVP